MYRILFTAKSLNSLKKLPTRIKNKADTLVDTLAIDYRDSRLMTKKLKTRQPLYSFRISREYRGIFEFTDSSTIKILDVRHRKDIYRKLK